MPSKFRDYVYDLVKVFLDEHSLVCIGVMKTFPEETVDEEEV